MESHDRPFPEGTWHIEAYSWQDEYKKNKRGGKRGSKISSIKKQEVP